MNAQRATQIACEALGWISQDEAVTTAFLAATGAEAQSLRAAARDPAFLSAVLDFVMADESQARGFCLHAGLSAEELHAARVHLPGGDLPHWT